MAGTMNHFSADEKYALSYDDALRLVRSYGKASVWVGHCMGVSRLAGRYGEIFSRRQELDVDFLRTAALVHDIGRCRTHDPILHGVEGYRLLSGLGYEREAFVCASHLPGGLERDEALRYGLPGQDFIPRTFEERLIPVIDSLVECDRPTTLEKRTLSIKKRYAGNEYFVRRIEEASRKVREFINQADSDFGISMERIAAETL